MNPDCPILEFDDAREAIIEPSKVFKPVDIPERCVMPIYHRVIEKLKSQNLLTHVRDIATPADQRRFTDWIMRKPPWLWFILAYTHLL